MTQEVAELQNRGREALEEVRQLTQSLEMSNKRRSEVQAVADELVPKYEALFNERIVHSNRPLDPRRARRQDRQAGRPAQHRPAPRGSLQGYVRLIQASGNAPTKTARNTRPRPTPAV